MAYGLKYYFVDKKIVGSTETTYRFEILEDGYSGSSTEWTGVSIKRQYEELSFRQINNIQKSTCNGQIRVEDSAQRTILETIASSELGDYQVKLKKNGSVVWTGLLVPDLTSITEENYGNQSANIQAKDIFFSGDYTLASGSEKAIVIIADLLDTLGYGLNIKAYTTWTESEISASDDVLNQVYHEKERLRTYAKTSGEVDRPISNEQALIYMLKTYGLILRQANNEWQLIQLSALDDTSSVPTTTYNSSGVQQGSPLTNVNLRESVDSDDLFLLGSSSNNYFAGIKRAKAKFDHQSVVQGIKIPRELWLTDTNESYSQFWQGDGTGNISLEFNLWVADTGNVADTYPSAQIRIQSGSYYWNGTTWGTSSTEISIEVSGPTTTDSDGNHVYKSGLVSIVTEPIPDAADGTLTITFIPSLTIVTSVVYSYFRDIVFNLSYQDDIENSLSIDFELEQTGTFNAEYDYGSFYFGDGPATASLSALKDSNDDLTDAWKQIGEATSVSHQEILLREIIDFQRGQRRNIRATLYGEFEPDKVVQYDSKSFFFLGGSWDSKSYQWTSNLIESDPTTGTDTLTTYYNTTGEGVTTSASTGSSGGGSGSSALYLEKANNLSDLQSVSTARTNLGLGTGDDVTFNTVTADFIGDLTGAIHVQGKNDTGGTLTKGTPVYISGQVAEGQQFTIGVADSDGSGTMPSIGILSADVNDNAMGDIVTHGKLIGIDTSSFTVGDELFIGSSGTLVNTPPTGESNLLQKIAKVIRVDATDGQIYIMGAGRTNAVPNLDEGDIFIGDSNNQAITKALSDTAVINELESDVIKNHLEIESLQDNKVEKGFIFPDDDGQALGTGDTPTFNGLISTGTIITDVIDTTSITWSTSTEVFSTSEEKFNNPVFIGTSLDVDNGINADQHIHAGTYLKSDTYLEVGTSATIGTTLDVGTNATVGGTLDVTGATTLNTLSVTGNATISGTLDAPTLNTGQGDNELYAMNQDVQTTDGVIFDTLSVTNSATIGTTLDVTSDATFNTSILLDATAKFESEEGYLSGFTGNGFNLSKVSSLYRLELDDMFIRGALFASEFIVNQISAVNGSDILSVGRGKVEEIASNFYTVSDPQGGNYASFAVDDIVIVQQVRPNDNQIVKRIVRQVTDVTNNVIELASLSGAPSDSGSIAVGDIIVAIGNTSNADRQGSIFRTVTETDSPYVRVNDGVASWADWTGYDKLKLQYGNLDSLTSTYSEVSGFGFFGDNTFLTGTFRAGDLNADTEYIEYNSTDGLKIKVGDETDLGASVAELRQDVIDIYLADQSTFAGIQFLSGQITLKVGADGKVASARLDATGDESAITLRADFFDFQSDDIVLIGDPDQDGGTQAKIALGASADSITIDGTEVGFIADGSGEFKAYADANNYIRLADSALDIKTESFNLDTTNLDISSANENIVIGTSPALMTVGKLSSQEQGIKIDSSGITNQNYWKLGQGDVQFKVGDGTNFLSFNENAGTFEIKSAAFDLESGNLHIDSDGTTFPSASSSSAQSSADKFSWSGSSWQSDSFAINDKTTVKFQFDYDITSTGEILIALYTSTNGTTFTAYSQSDTTAVINMFPEFADNSKSFATTGSPPAEKPGFQFSINNKINNRIDALDGENPSGGRYRTGTVTLYIYIADIGDASHIKFEVYETVGSLAVCDAENIETQEFQSVTELNPSGVFTRLSDAVILANGDKYLNPELIT
jgi:hypothetical protein